MHVNVLLDFRFGEFRLKSENTKPKLTTSFSDKLIALIRNVGSQPLCYAKTDDWFWVCLF